MPTRAPASIPSLREWAALTADAAVRMTVGPALCVLAVEPAMLWPLALGILCTATAVLGLAISWMRVRVPRWLSSPWAVTTPLALACLLSARPWFLQTGWPIAAGCLLFWLSGPLWTGLVRSRRSAQLALWVTATAGLWASARLYVGLYPSLHMASTVLGLWLAGYASACALASRLPTRVLWPAACAGLVAVLLSLTASGSRNAVRAYALAHRSITPDLLAAAWAVADFDNDGAATIWGGADCESFDSERGPGNWDVPGDGIDQDCSGSDRAPPHIPGRTGTARGPTVNMVVIITGDSLRFDAVGAYGRESRPITANLDAWAKRAMRFERAYSTAPETRSSLPAILWGVDARATGYQSLAERVRGSGGRHARAVIPAKARFDETVRRAGFTLTTVDETDSGRINEHVWAPLQDVAEHGGVLWVHYFDPHAPYAEVPGVHWGDDSKSRYLGVVTRFDRAVGELLKRIPSDAAVIVASDHGEAFGEHGMYYHRSSLYDEQVRVPLLIAVPNGGPGVVKQTVGLIDVYATVLELLDLEPTAGVDSRSLVPALRGEALLDVPYRASTWSMVDGLGPPNTWFGLFYRNYKLLRRTDWNLEELYDIESDPKELHPNTREALQAREALRAMQ